MLNRFQQQLHSADQDLGALPDEPLEKRRWAGLGDGLGLGEGRNRGSGSSLSSPHGSSSPVLLRLLIACGILATLCGCTGLIMMTFEYESGIEIADRLGLLVPHGIGSVVAAGLLQGKEAIADAGNWRFNALHNNEEVANYLKADPRMAVHMGAFIEASLGAINLPTERLGYTYTVCAAGGSLSWDHFANADAVGMKQSLTPDLKRLTRVFTYSTTSNSDIIPDVLHKCGRVIEMNPPATDLVLPYSSQWDVELTVVEHWNSTGCNLRSSNTVEGAGATAAGGEQRVSILPLDQWTPTSLTMRMRITSKRASFDGTALHNIKQSVSRDRFESMLAHFNGEHQEALFEEIRVHCNLQEEVDIVRCLSPVTMYVGEPPLLTSRIYERWHGDTFTDRDSDL